MVGFAIASPQQQGFIVLISLVLFLGVEVLKWIAYYKIIKRKKSRWMLFYWIYTGISEINKNP